jgi:hypothetical protein
MDNLKVDIKNLLNMEIVFVITTCDLSYNYSSVIHISKIIAELQFIVRLVSLSLAETFVSALNFFLPLENPN